MNALSRSWQITKLSYAVLKQDKELLLYPLLSFISSIGLVVLLVVPSLTDNPPTVESVGYPALFFLYLGVSFIAIFFNVCTVHTTLTRFQKKNATFLETLGFAFSKFHLILGWSLMTATVGLILRLLDGVAERMGPVGEMLMRVFNSFLGAAWSLLTVFVVPAMVYHDIGPMEAIRRSASAFKKTWGENIVRGVGFGLLILLFIVGGIAAFLGLGYLLRASALVLLPIAVLYIILVALVFSVLTSVFNTALYVYAATGKVPMGFDSETMRDAFRNPHQGKI